MKLLVKEFKGSSFRLVDINTRTTYRAMKSDFKNLLVGSLLNADIESSDDLILKMTINNEVFGDSSKQRIEVCTDEVKLGDLIDGVPVLSFGKEYAKKGKRTAYAYFS